MKLIKINKLEEEKLDFILSQFVNTHKGSFDIYKKEIKLQENKNEESI